MSDQSILCRDIILKKLTAQEPLWGGWRIADFIGSGAFGCVFRIERDDLGEHFVAALKVIALTQSLDRRLKTIDSIKESLGREAKEIIHLYRLSGHQNVVSWKNHDIFFESEGNTVSAYVMVMMEHLPDSLAEELKKGPMPWNRAVSILADALAGLEYIHGHGIIHRDIKPENIFIAQDGTAKIGDFGVARKLSETSRARTVTGTPLYMAPEVLKDPMGTGYDHRADIYSLGLVAYEMLEGVLPFEQEMAGDVSYLIEKRLEARDPITFTKNVPPALQAAIKKALAFAPSDRFLTAQEFRSELTRVLAGGGQDAASLGETVRVSPDQSVSGSAQEAFRPVSAAESRQEPPASSFARPAEQSRPASEVFQQPAPDSGSSYPEQTGPDRAVAQGVHERKGKSKAGVFAVAAVVLAVLVGSGMYFIASRGPGPDKPAPAQVAAEKEKEYVAVSAVLQDENLVGREVNLRGTMEEAVLQVDEGGVFVLKEPGGKAGLPVLTGKFPEAGQVGDFRIRVQKRDSGVYGVDLDNPPTDRIVAEVKAHVVQKDDEEKPVEEPAQKPAPVVAQTKPSKPAPKPEPEPEPKPASKPESQTGSAIADMREDVRDKVRTLRRDGVPASSDTNIVPVSRVLSDPTFIHRVVYVRGVVDQVEEVKDGRNRYVLRDLRDGARILVETGTLPKPGSLDTHRVRVAKTQKGDVYLLDLEGMNFGQPISSPRTGNQAEQVTDRLQQRLDSFFK